MTSPRRAAPNHRADVDRLLAGDHHNPHLVLGPHRLGEHTVVRAFHPDATRVTLRHAGGEVEAERIDDRGLFEARLDDSEPPGYLLHLETGRHSWEQDDPYRFLPTLGDLDLHLITQGQHRELWRRLGARVTVQQGVSGTAFSVWAPNARGVSLVSDAAGWDTRPHPMRSLGSSGVWELFLPNVGEGLRYKFRVLRADGRGVIKMDPLARAMERPPATACIVTCSHHQWQDATWLAQRASTDWTTRPFSVYEVHLGSWRRGSNNTELSYLDLAGQLAEYCVSMGFTHVEFMPISEHPFGGSWGYQVSGYYAPSARYGSPDDLRVLIDTLHQHGIGVLIDWVPAHFPRDEWALARFDGTALYEHIDPRRGEHPDWGTYIFNYSRNEVRNFLVANARYWVEEFHIDGIRIDAVASMLYLDYSREHGEWMPNIHGGRENLEAIVLLRELNETLGADFPGVMTIAEESTAWPGVTRLTSTGGLGFVFKWNLGWMNDTLSYMHTDAIFRRYHHHQLTFGLWYAWSEKFVLPISHDEVVHGKGSLLAKMPGDRWQQFANVRALLGWMWAHPGKKLLFMGCEIAQEREWSHDHSLDWHLLDLPEHRGTQMLVRDLNARYRGLPALWERDRDPGGFSWIDAGNVDQNVVSFLRYDNEGRPAVACVANFSPNVHDGFRLGLPLPGRWREVMNTDAREYGGSGVGNLGGVETSAISWHGHYHSVSMVVPPLAVVWLEYQGSSS